MRADGVSNEWPRVALGDVLRHVARPVNVQATKSYREIGIRSHGKGIFHKQEVVGTELGEKKVFWVEPGDFVLNIVFAWEGAVAMVGEAERGMIGSHRFPTFRAVDERVDLNWLVCYLRTREGLSLLDRVSPGGAGRNRTLSRTAFLKEKVPLPPIDMQRRIVAHIDSLCAKIDEAALLKERQVADGNAAIRSHIVEEISVATVTLAELVEPRIEEIIVNREETYNFAGVYSFGRGVFRSATRRGYDFSYSRLRTVRAGDLIYPKLMAWEGAFGVVPPHCDGCVVSPEFQVFRVFDNKVVPEFLEAYLQTPSTWPRIAIGSTGTNARRQRLSPVTFLKHSMRLPSKTGQEAVRVAVRMVKELIAGKTAFDEDLRALRSALIERAIRGEM